MLRTLRVFGILGFAFVAGSSRAGLSDLTQTPNLVNEGIAKSLTEEIGEGRGNLTTTDSSLYLIARDPFRSIRRGRQLFQRKFTLAQGLGPRAATASAKTSTSPPR